MTGIAGRKALVKVTGALVTFTDEACTDSGDHQTYQITNTAKRVWDRTTALVVKVATVVTVESYTFNRLTGTVVFATVNAGRGAVTVSGAYLPLSIAVGGRQYSVTITKAVLDDSDFDSVNTASGFSVHQTGLKDITGTIDIRFSTDTYFRDALLQGDPVVIEFFSDRTASPVFTCWALLNKQTITAAFDSLDESTIAFDGAPDDTGVVVA